jgi:predicted nucleic acid-binding protein
VKVALDTNVLAYAEGVNGEERRDDALDLVRRLPQAATVIPVQALGELFNVLVRKAGKSRTEARDTILGWRDAFGVIETSSEIMQAATDLSTDHQLSIWDAVIISAASLTGCRLLLSEDLQAGFTWGGVTVVNPFARPRHPLLDALLEVDADEG